MRTAGTLVTVPPVTALSATWAMAAHTLGSTDGAERAAKAWCDAVLGVVGARVHARVHDDLDPEGTYVFVSNHQSHVDVPVIVRTWPGPIRFVAKRSLGKIPIFGHALHMLGHVIIDRRNSEDSRRRLAHQVERVRTEVSVLFFAEGTRSRDGSLQAFKKGCLMLAELSGVPVVPIAVSGTRDILASGKATVRSGPVGIVFGAPMPHMADTSRSRDERITELRSEVQALKQEADALCYSPDRRVDSSADQAGNRSD